MDATVVSNLGDTIHDRPDDYLWLVEIESDGRERAFTYGSLREQVAGVARSVQGAGLKPGARVGLLGRNSAEYLITYYGIMQAGYCPVPIGIKLAAETVDHIVSDAAIEFMYADRDWLERLDGRVPGLALDDRQAWHDHLDFGPFTPVSMSSGDFATILYTSGSTGVPKGVPLTHGGYIWTLEQALILGGQYIQDTGGPVLAAAPLSHMNALFMSKVIAAYGGTEILLTQFTAAGYLNAIAQHRCRIISSVPTMLALCAREKQLIDELDLSSVATVATGSAPSTDALFDQVRTMFPGATVQNGWGSTETGPAVFGPQPDGLPRPPLSVGYPLPAVQVKLESGSDPCEGQLLVRSKAVMPGYVNRPDDTASRLVDGWYKTGDIMRRDQDGFYFFVGRVDDMFVCGGENLYPGEIERLLEQHPAVAQAAVLPIDDQIKGHIPVAFIVCKPGKSASAEEIKAFSLERAPAYQHPRFVVFVDELPLSAANKVDKAQLQARAQTLRRH